MKTAASLQPNSVSDEPEEMRAAPRFVLLIRAAKLLCSHGEFVCVIRDVSETGISVRLFHRLPDLDEFTLHTPDGGVYALRRVWERSLQAGFQFGDSVDVEGFIHEAGKYPKRGLRLGLCLPVSIRTVEGVAEGIIENLSQQGARIQCEAAFEIDRSLNLSGEGFKEIRAKVRWRKDDCHGVVFDDTFALPDFARLAAKFQAPALLGG